MHTARLASLVSLLVLASCQSTTTKNGAPNGGGAGGTLYYSLPTKLEIHKLDLGSGADEKLGKGEGPSVAADGNVVYTTPTSLVESPQANQMAQQRTIIEGTIDGDPQTGAGFQDPRVSPDGTKVAYVTLQGSLYVVDRADGTVLSSFDNTGGGTHTWERPTWTNDGTLYVGGGFGNPGLYRSDAAFAKLDRFDPSFAEGMFADRVYPAVSPDGTRVAFVRNKQVNVMNVDGSGLTILDTDDSAEDTYPTWSPDSSQIAYFATAGHLMIRPAAGGAATDVLDEFPALADEILIFETTVQMDWH